MYAAHASTAATAIRSGRSDTAMTLKVAFGYEIRNGSEGALVRGFGERRDAGSCLPGECCGALAGTLDAAAALQHFEHRFEGHVRVAALGNHALDEGPLGRIAVL